MATGDKALWNSLSSCLPGTAIATLSYSDNSMKGCCSVLLWVRVGDFSCFAQTAVIQSFLDLMVYFNRDTSEIILISLPVLNF